MSSRLLRAAAASVALFFALTLPVLGHSGGEASGISVEPAQVTAGATVILAGNGLEPDSDRLINLVGPDVVVPFPTATTDTDGMFNVTLMIPAHLPSGTYTFQAIGDETLTTDLTVTAAAGQAASEPKNEAAAAVTARSRSGLELGIIAVLLVVAIGLGLVLVARAERVGRTLQP
ncbi:MAG TPA: hypothetical protein VEO91_11750 [Candidatus Limnocylindria bacterium]|nr:hypothetical protein [Candidatus Limnocylindria bacterium]